MGSRRIAVMERASGTESFVVMEIFEDAAVVGGLFCRVTAKTALVSRSVSHSAHTRYRIQYTDIIKQLKEGSLLCSSRWGRTLLYIYRAYNFPPASQCPH